MTPGPDPRPSTGGRVLVYANSLELGGSQINAVQLAAASRAHGYEPLVVGPRDSRKPGPSLFDVAHQLDVPLLPVDRPRTTREGARVLEGLARAHHADVVHAYGTWSIRPAYWGPCRLGRRPLVVTVYEMAVDPVVYAHSSLVVGTGYLVDDLAARPGPVTLVSPPVDLVDDDPRTVDTGPFLAAHGLEPSHLRVVIVSRLDGLPLRPSKTQAVEAAIDLVEAAGRDDLDLVVVGTGKDEGPLRARAEAVNARLGRRACVLVGAMADPRPAYACADVVIGMGGSAARGLAFGKPLVVSGEFGTFETFTPEKAQALFRTSFWCEDRVSDPTSRLADALLPLLTDPGRRAALGAFSRRFAEENFGLDAMAERLTGVYDAARAYSPTDWLADLTIEWHWASAWVGRRVLPDSAVSRRARRWVDDASKRVRGEDEVQRAR